MSSSATHKCEDTGGRGRTRFASRAAKRSKGMKMRQKTRDSRTNPFVARVCGSHLVSGQRRNTSQDGKLLRPCHWRGSLDTYDDSVVPCKGEKLIETGDEVPTRGDVSSYEDSNAQDGERVHRIATARGTACREMMYDAKGGGRDAW